MEFLTEDKKTTITDFVKFVKDELGIKKCPTVVLQNGQGQLKTTAAYDYSKENKVVKVNAKNRALVDVLRSIAHEMVHHKQWEDGKLDGPKPPDIGGEIEDEANSKAGQFIKMFAKDNKKIYQE
jgi:Zn-dependent peptidase ImmA (M78 family)